MGIYSIESIPIGIKSYPAIIVLSPVSGYVDLIGQEETEEVYESHLYFGWRRDAKKYKLRLLKGSIYSSLR